MRRASILVLLAACTSGPQSRVPAPRTKPGTGIDFDTMVDREAERMRKDEKYVAQCMRAKGYSDAAN